MAVVILTPNKKPMTKSKSFGIGYITREDKAYKSLFLNCTKENYAQEFQDLFALREVQRKDSRTFYHIKQSFDDSDHVDYETAFSIAKELAKKYYEEGYQVVCATHKDTDHVHNHIIFSAVNSNTLKSFPDTKENLKELLDLHDSIMKRYDFKTQEDLAKEKLLSRKEGMEENKLKDRGVFTNKELITYAIDAVIADKEKVKNIYDFVKEINKRYKIHCYFRGSFINFQLGAKKYRGKTLGESYSLAAIKRRCSGSYTKKEEMEDKIKTFLKEASTKEDFLQKLREEGIGFKETSSDFLVRIEDKDLSIKELTGYSKEHFFREISLNDLKKKLKLDIYHMKEDPSIDSFEKWKEELGKLSYIDEVREQEDTLLLSSSSLLLDIKKLGFGPDEKNRFSLDNIKKNLFIKQLGNDLREEVQKGTISKVEDIFRYCRKHEISFVCEGKNTYIQYENSNINLKRFSVFSELNKKDWKAFFVALNKIKSFDDIEKIKGVTKEGDEFYFKGVAFSDIEYNKKHLNSDGILSLFEQNIFNHILRKSFSYPDFLEKYNYEKLSVEFKENEVKNQIENNKARRSFYTTIRGCTSRSEILEAMSENEHVEFTEKEVYYTCSESSGYYRVNLKFLDDVLKENALKNDFFSSLKESLTYASFEEGLKRRGRIFEEKEGSILLDGIDFTEKEIINEFGTNLFSKDYIEERIKENYDHEYKTTTSLKYQFKEVYLNTLKESHSLQEFQTKLLENDQFDFKFAEDAILFKKEGKGWTNSKEYNYYNSNFYSLSSAKEWIEKRNDFERKQMLQEFFFALSQFFRQDDRKQQHRKVNTQSASYFKYLRIHREMEEKYRL